jgi:hypothetical protein
VIRESEKKAFQAFHNSAPQFARRIVSCKEGTDPPDFICEDQKGIRVGVELAEWVNGTQIAISKHRYDVRQTYGQAIASPPIKPTNIGRVWLHPADKLPSAQVVQFRQDLFDAITGFDSQWQTLADRWSAAQGIPVRDFSNYPLLQKHVLQLDLFSRTDMPFSVTFLGSGGPYSPKTAYRALLSVLGKKVGMYQGLHAAASLSELYLVIYWWQGYIHNSPYDRQGYGLQDVANELQPIVAANPGQFQRIFLFDYAKNIVIQV